MVSHPVRCLSHSACCPFPPPQVVLGVPYTMAIDMWSLGCVAAELFLGLPLFPGACEHDLLSRLVATLGPPPDAVLAAGKNTSKYFAERGGGGPRGGPPLLQAVAGAPRGVGALGKRGYRLRSREEFEAVTGQSAPLGKTYFQHTALGDIVGAYPFRCALCRCAGGGSWGAAHSGARCWVPGAWWLLLLLRAVRQLRRRVLPLCGREGQAGRSRGRGASSGSSPRPACRGALPA